MSMWIVIAALIAIGVTALLAGLFYRLNNPARFQRRKGDDGVYLGPDGAGSTPGKSPDQDSRSDDGGSDGGGGDGGGD